MLRLHKFLQPAYPSRVNLQSSFRNAVLTPQIEAYNQAMSSVRSSVEWLFRDIVNYIKFLDLRKNLKLGLSSVGKMYIVCTLLRNSLTCLYGNSTSEFFECNHPEHLLALYITMFFLILINRIKRQDHCVH